MRNNTIVYVVVRTYVFDSIMRDTEVSVAGVFSTKEKAKEYIDNSGTVYDWEIEEMEFDRAF